MKHLQILKSPVDLGLNYTMTGDPVINQIRKLKDLKGIFQDEKAFAMMDSEQPVYSVQSWMPVAEGTPGGLFFGVSTIMPGKVDNEYFMTKGHFHAQSDRAEFYWGVQGKGMLILMDRDRNTWAEEVYPGSLHYIGGEIAHRLANTGAENLIVGACWPSDAGHDYEEVAVNGFSSRLLEVDGKSVLV
ncbi:MAG: glucose-6-phosphate isomerase [Bacteroidetes bacterium GWF2_42_66]|nr:MAG: glucose-6-phosphate isomerase [Bacteroidetes bacterium GWA2_42_15]OFY01462.1 MAG: glucose-6-phosphate isomerase [Bacteroidetes bacterium GWE2_42_39]OFY43357.1 MAG: glucose-6-phosphate isomerase [Bacteroidetes bacterium GWF2_42_66]HBL77459.1 glucose-6-phosphate isomerase [Prolixibacteraceae bacterium]HCR91823.1 glucose-6-phosphate isomerase [Prolixibacteraceae bacterium]